MAVNNLKDAARRISQLEAENARLKKENAGLLAREKPARKSAETQKDKQE